MVTTHGGIPKAIGMKVDFTEDAGLPAGAAGTNFIIILPMQ